MAASSKRVRTRDVVAEGLYIASAATRLSLKNTILVHILADELASYGPEVRVVEPAALRDQVIARLERTLRLHAGPDAATDEGAGS